MYNMFIKDDLFSSLKVDKLMLDVIKCDENNSQLLIGKYIRTAASRMTLFRKLKAFSDQQRCTIFHECYLMYQIKTHTAKQVMTTKKNFNYT